MTPNDKPLPGANAALGWLMAINLFNYIDRQVLNAVLPRLKLDGTLFAADDPWVNTKLGSLTSAFMVVYMIFAPVVGWLDGHGYRRWVILGVGVTIWSLASGSSGFATSFAVLFATRCLVGVGEGAYGPVSSAMLADIYPARLRGTVMALFNMGVPVGSALGFVIGGLVSDYFEDWRHAFWFTFLGLVIGAGLFFKREFPRLAVADGDRHSYPDLVKGLARNRSFVLCCAGMTAIVFVSGGLAVWAPVYIFEREARFTVTAEALDKLASPGPKETRRPVPADVIAKLTPKIDAQEHDMAWLKTNVVGALSEPEREQFSDSLYNVLAAPKSVKPGEIATYFGGILVFGGLGATALGGYLGEKLRDRVRGGYFWVSAAGALFALPCYLAMLYAPFPLAWVFIFLTICGLFLYIGPAYTLISNVVGPEVRATAFGLNILVIHALGDVPSPTLIGLVNDARDLHTALLLMSGVILLGAVLWVAGAQHYEADVAAAERNG